jgi:2'-5' RNA ligase
MTVEELNALVEDAYLAAFAFEDELTDIYLKAFNRAGREAARRFSAEAVTAAAFVAPPLESLTTGMTAKEEREADRVRNEAALAIAAALAALGLTAIAVSFLAAIAQRGSLNFDQELMLVLRRTVEQGLAEGWTADRTALALREMFSDVSFTTAQMLAQTELTSLVNERSLQAAQKATSGKSEPTYKVWQTMQDPKVRPAHAHVQGQTVPINQPFDVSGYLMMYPGDPSAPVRLVARCRCRMTYTETMVASAEMAARPDVGGQAMIAVYPMPLEARSIAAEGANPWETLHVTLIFLGPAADLDMEAVNEVAAMVASSCQPLQGAVGGVGFFASGPDGVPLLALPDVQGLSALRECVAMELAAVGVESPSEHGWLPHMTLDYQNDPSVPDLALLGESLHFDYLSVVVADERTDYRLGGVPAASAEEDTLMSSMATGTTNELTAGIVVTITESEDDANEVENEVEDAGEGGVEEPMAWRALLAIEGQATEDGRIIDVGALTWRDLPLSLMAMDETGPGGHEGAQVSGRIDTIERQGAEIWGSGVFDTGEFGQKICRMVGEQTLRGNSVDLAVLAYEYRNAETGEALSDEELMDAFFGDIPILFAVTEGVIMASTVCPTPAIAGAEIMLASGVMTMTFSFVVEAADTLTASAAGMAPLHPPSDWFADPRLEGPTPLTVTKDGKVYGHAALWNSCHIGEPSGPGICVPPPRSGMSYEVFHHGVVETADGTDVPCGQITMSTLHAGRDLGWKAARQHYEDSGCAVADVIAGEDRHGIWVSGGLRPDLPAEKVRELKAGSLSGDWRQVIDRGLEFLAALVVNIPGFPIPRPEARIVASAAGEEEVLALVAAGMVADDDVEGMSRREYLRKIAALTH